MICKKCGSEISKNSKLCPDCGYVLSDIDEKKHSVNKKASTTVIASAIIGFCIIIAAVLVCLVITFNRKTDISAINTNDFTSQYSANVSSSKNEETTTKTNEPSTTKNNSIDKYIGNAIKAGAERAEATSTTKSHYFSSPNVIVPVDD